MESAELNARLEQLALGIVTAALRSGSLPRAARIIAAGQVLMAREVRSGMGLETAGAPSEAPLLGRVGSGIPLLEAAEDSVDLRALYLSTLQDTARQMMATTMAAAPAVVGCVRQTDGKACSRCMVLAGKFYRWNQGFLRHPRCGCTHTPVKEGESRKAQAPRDLFDALSAEEQDRRFGKAGAEAIRMGADMSRVVNARRGIGTAQMFGRQVAVTTTGTARIYRGPGPRLMPESIIAASGGNRDQAVELLRRFGYLL